MTRRLTRAAVLCATVAATTIALAACAPTASVPRAEGHAPPPLQRDPAPAADPPQLDIADQRLPLQFDGARLVDPGWEAAPQRLDGILFAPVQADGHLEFTAIDSQGSALWSVQRPLACAGYALTRGPDGVPVAVVNDSRPSSDSIAHATASAYDLRTGDLLWGPVDVPGTHQGPGLIYAEPSPEAMGATGPRRALDGATGATVADETDQDSRVLAERDGVVLLEDGDALRGIDGAGEELWTSAPPSPGERLQASPAVKPGGPLVALTSRTQETIVIDTRSGAVLEHDVSSASFDPTTQALVASSAQQLWATDVATGERLWESSLADTVRVDSAGAAQAYARHGDSVRVLNVLTGAVTPGFADGQGTLLVPIDITAAGAGVIPYDDGFVLATTPTGR